MPIASQFPVPCIREAPTGWVVQLNRACAVPVKTREEGIAYAEARRLAKERGKLFAQIPNTLRFELVDEEDLTTAELEVDD